MKTLKILLDTSVYSAMMDKRDPIRQTQTLDFWKNIDQYELYFSSINKEEIDAIKDEKLKKKMQDFFIIKGKELELLLALTTVYSIDILISWNFKHLVKRKTRIELI